MPTPDPKTLYPLPGYPRAVFLRNFITRPNLEVGEFTYYDDPDGAERWEQRNVLHHHEFLKDKLVIGRFCALATGSRFIMNGANHLMAGFSTYPFEIFGGMWGVQPDIQDYIDASRGDTVVGHDVWIGDSATVLPGVKIGSGAIVAAGSLVTKDVPAYAIVAGNPARVVRQRFDDATTAALLEVAWWNWPADMIVKHLPAIRGASVDQLRAAASRL